MPAPMLVTPPLFSVTEPPSATAPPPDRPVPALLATAVVCNMAFVPPPAAMLTVPVPVMDPPVRPAPVSTSVTPAALVSAAQHRCLHSRHIRNRDRGGHR